MIVDSDWKLKRDLREDATPRSNYATEQAERHGAPKPQDPKLNPTEYDDFLADSTPPSEQITWPPEIHYAHEDSMRIWAIESQTAREGRPENMSDEEIIALSKKPSVPFEKPIFVEETRGAGFTITITQTAPDVFYGVVTFNSDGRKLSAVHENKHHVRQTCSILAEQNVRTADINCESAEGIE